jgi:hypothetical protein
VNLSFQEATPRQSQPCPEHLRAHHDSVTRLGHRCRANGGGGWLCIDALVNTATQAQVSSPALAIQSILNNGITSVVSNLGAGVTNTVSDAANNQLIQQVITAANIGITGLSQTIQQNVASTVASRLAVANSQFR